MRGIYNARFIDMKTEAQMKSRGRSEPCCLRPQSPDSALFLLLSYDGVNRSGLHKDKVILGAGSEWNISPRHHLLCAKNCSAGSKIELLTWSGSGVPGGYCSSASRRWGPVWRLGLTEGSRHEENMGSRSQAGLWGLPVHLCGREQQEGSEAPLGWPSPLSPFSGTDGYAPQRSGQQGSIC